MSQAAERIRQAATRKPKEKLTALLHHITTEALSAAYFSLKKEAASGVDGVTWHEYGDDLTGRLLDLHNRVHSGAYRALPSRRVEIPKPDGGTRPLGIAALEDKIVQKAVAETILLPIFEPEFLRFSYGFRPGRGAHDALDALAFGINRRKVNRIVDADIRAYFERIDRDWLVRFLEHRIGDRRVIRLIVTWLNAGVMEGAEWKGDLRGTPQGAIVSPILANIYLHYVLDLWFHKKWRARTAEGNTIIVRYADDFVVGFQHKRDAERFLCDLKDRLASFSLELHPDKNPPRRVRQVRRCGPPGTRRAASRNLRLSRVHALLHDREKRKFRTGAEADREAGRSNPEAHQDRTASADAPQPVRGCRVAGESAGRFGCATTRSRTVIRPLQRFAYRLRTMWLRVLRQPP